MNIIYWIQNHKKLSLAIIAGVFLGTYLLFTLFQAIKDRFFPSGKPVQQTATQTPTDIASYATMLITSPKYIYIVNEKIPVKIIANTQGSEVSAFDTLISFDPEFLTLAERKPPSLPDFLYFGKNNNTLISVSAVLKPGPNTGQAFNGTTLFELEFSAKKAGKTSLDLVYSPNSTNESNLISPESRDILTTVSGAKLEIK